MSEHAMKRDLAAVSAPLRTRGFDYSPWVSLPPLHAASRPAFVGASVDVGILERSVALVLLVLLIPVLLLIALAIKLDSPGGPVLYRQERVGLDRRRRGDGNSAGAAENDRRRARGFGRVFPIVKFRTMVPNAERATGPVWASDRDPRITRIGGVLRQLRLDEVPQLLNIVLGQMRLIGPRPERPLFVEQFCRDIPEYQRRLAVPPGITGLAQVERAYDASLDDVHTKLKYDLFYVGHRCVLMDLKILAKTVDVMFRGKGAR